MKRKYDSNKLTGANAGGRRWLLIPTRWAARIAQFCRSHPSNPSQPCRDQGVRSRTTALHSAHQINMTLCFSRIVRLVAISLTFISPLELAAQYVCLTNLDNTLTIGSYYGPSGPVVIPTNIYGLPVTCIGDYCFYAYAGAPMITSVTIPKGIRSIGKEAFYYQTSLANADLPDGLLTIADEAFYGCFALSSAAIPDTVTSIGDSAFNGCRSLTAVTLPSGMQSIGQDAFYGCRLTAIAIPGTVTNLGLEAVNCMTLTNISVDPLNPRYRSVNGALLDKAHATFLRCPQALAGSYTIPEGTLEVAQSAFQGCSLITNVNLPPGLTTIDENAFYSCSRLSYLELPTTVTNIPLEGFDGSGLTKILIPDSVRSIGDYAFNNCTKLTNAIVGRNVIRLGYSAFSWCTLLKSLYFTGNAPGYVGSTFYSASQFLTVFNLPGTAGFRSTYDGKPVVLWNPLIQLDTARYLPGAHSFGFNITGTSNVMITVEACANLQTPTWFPVRTYKFTNDLVVFKDLDATTNPPRFYRIRSP